MSHELTTRESGLVEFAFRADHGAPWHGLGQPIPAEHYHDVDHWRAQAGMDWRIQRSRVRFFTGSNYYSLSDSVSIAKEAARQIQESV